MAHFEKMARFLAEVTFNRVSSPDTGFDQRMCYLSKCRQERRT